MNAFFLILIFLVFGLARAGADTNCNSAGESLTLNKFEAELKNKESSESIFTRLNDYSNASVQQIGVLSIASDYARFLCSQADQKQQQLCARIAARIIDSGVHCLLPTMTVKELRPLATAFLRNSEFTALILPKILGSGLYSKADQIRHRLWTNYKILVLPEAIKTPQGVSQKFSVAELLKFEAGYANIQKALVNRFGRQRLNEFSHVWGAFGVLARVGKLTIKGQFGEVYSDNPMLVNVVINVVQANFKDTDLAQRIAHENTHSNDLILGRFLTGIDANWSTTAEAKIFAECGLPVGDNVELFSCRNKHLDWFNFHPTNYAATNAPEFYGKMMDEWIRENLNLVSAGRYRCQNQNTLIF